MYLFEHKVFGKWEEFEFDFVEEFYEKIKEELGDTLFEILEQIRDSMGTHPEIVTDSDETLEIWFEGTSIMFVIEIPML